MKRKPETSNQKPENNKRFLGQVTGCWYLVSLTLAIWPSIAGACPVCFGDSGATGLTRGFYWGIMLLLVLPFVLIAAIGGRIIFALRKHRAIQDQPEASP